MHFSFLAAVASLAVAAPTPTVVDGTFDITDYKIDCATGELAFNVVGHHGKGYYSHNLYQTSKNVEHQPNLIQAGPSVKDIETSTFQYTSKFTAIPGDHTYHYVLASSTCNIAEKETCTLQTGIPLSIEVNCPVPVVAPITATYAVTDYTYECSTGDIAFQVAVNPGPNTYSNYLKQTSVNAAGEPTLIAGNPLDNSYNSYAFTANVKDLTKATTFTYEFAAQNCYYGNKGCQNQENIKISFEVKACAAPAPAEVIKSTWGIKTLNYDFKTGAIAFSVQADFGSSGKYASTLVQSSHNSGSQSRLTPIVPSPADIVSNTFSFTASVDCSAGAASYSYVFVADNCIYGPLPQTCYKQEGVEVYFAVNAECQATVYGVKLA
ncbi:hypothetical protein HDU98_006658 [Podochytrium sp. JEL0797]|nr:hypothetical protein HDU98_006658 [Podochytrium sp. JEL0797]